MKKHTLGFDAGSERPAETLRVEKIANHRPKIGFLPRGARLLRSHAPRAKILLEITKLVEKVQKKMGEQKLE